MKVGDMPSGEEFWVADKQFFCRNPDGFQEKIVPFRGQKARRLGMLAFFKQALMLAWFFFSTWGLKFPLPISGNRYIHFTKLVRGVLLLWPLRLLPVSLFLCHICCTPARHPTPPPSHSIGTDTGNTEAAPRSAPVALPAICVPAPRTV